MVPSVDACGVGFSPFRAVCSFVPFSAGFRRSVAACVTRVTPSFLPAVTADLIAPPVGHDNRPLVLGSSSGRAGWKGSGFETA